MTFRVIQNLKSQILSPQMCMNTRYTATSEECLQAYHALLRPDELDFDFA